MAKAKMIYGLSFWRHQYQCLRADQDRATCGKRRANIGVDATKFNPQTKLTLTVTTILLFWLVLRSCICSHTRTARLISGEFASMSQSTISSFFPQSPKKPSMRRPHPKSPQAVTDGAGERPPVKRRRVAGGFFDANSASGPTQENARPKEPGTGSISRYKCGTTPSQSEPSQGPSNAASSRQQRRDRLRSILLAEDNVFSQRGRHDHEDDANDELDDEDAEIPDSQETREDAFHELMRTFESSDPRGKRKATAKKSARLEIGPSGEPYTPFELQVMVSLSELHITPYENDCISGP